MKNDKCRLAIFASGRGTNAEAIINHFTKHPSVEVTTIYTNNANAYVIERAKKYNIPVVIFTKSEFSEAKFRDQLISRDYELLILAGFMWLVPPGIVNAYKNRIINIHPALLPKYGGQGMYGHHVHDAVVLNKEVESGITIHYVNEKYDDGDIIFQTNCKVLANDTADSVAKKIHLLEHEHYPSVIEEICDNLG